MILFDSVTKKYAGDNEPALDDVSLHIEPNEFVFLVGKSGAGKSTLMKMITKEEVPDAGKIIVGGIDLDYVKKRHIPGYRRRLGVVFQDFKLLPRRTVYENVAFALEIAGMSGKEIRRTVPKVLELVDLLGQAKKFPDQLSGGQKQRVSIARSVARQPKILIADEPTANLDKLTTKEIIDLLKKINDFGTTILVTTHNELIVNTLQKRVITMKHGKIIDDQKNNGIYRLDERPVVIRSERIVQVPGHALRQSSNTMTIASEVLEKKPMPVDTTSNVNGMVTMDKPAVLNPSMMAKRPETDNHDLARKSALGQKPVAPVRLKSSLESKQANKKAQLPKRKTSSTNKMTAGRTLKLNSKMTNLDEDIKKISKTKLKRRVF